GCRTPMPWTSGPQRGFTTGRPWLPLAAEHAGLSVAEQEADPASTLAFARSALALRKAHPALTRGEIEFLDAPDPLLAFVRTDGDERILCVFNLGGEARTFEGPDLKGAAIQLSLGEASLNGPGFSLGPFAGVLTLLSPPAARR
ncbi:MAG: alpha-glucosidase C-terminal domain-containing protein, partial [Phenylobacterium sp.]